MLRDIDYAAAAVRRAIEEKFARKEDLEGLDVSAGESTISVDLGQRRAEGTRDNLLATLRKSATLDEFFSSPVKSARLHG